MRIKGSEPQGKNMNKKKLKLNTMCAYTMTTSCARSYLPDHGAKLPLNNHSYYSFKIFCRFWLVKTTHIKYHNQLLYLERILSYWTDDVKSAAWLQVIELLTEKTWGRGWLDLVVRTKWCNCRGTFYSFHGQILSKNITRTARRQHLLFGV